jgi:hypothetical protein
MEHQDQHREDILQVEVEELEMHLQQGEQVELVVVDKVEYLYHKQQEQLTQVVEVEQVDPQVVEVVLV